MTSIILVYSGWSRLLMLQVQVPDQGKARKSRAEADDDYHHPCWPEPILSGFRFWVPSRFLPLLKRGISIKVFDGG
jgi:hypothetical protein